MVHWGVGPIPAGVTGVSLHLSKARLVPLHTRAMGEPALRVNVGTKWFFPGKFLWIVVKDVKTLVVYDVE